MRLPDKFTRGRLMAMCGSHAQLCTRTDYAGDSGDGFFDSPPIGSQEHGASQRDPALTHQDLHIRVSPEPVDRQLAILHELRIGLHGSSLPAKQVAWHILLDSFPHSCHRGER